LSSFVGIPGVSLRFSFFLSANTMFLFDMFLATQVARGMFFERVL